MELDELKQSWQALDQHLKDKEMIKSDEIHRLISRANKKLHTLTRFSQRIILVALPIIALLVNGLFICENDCTPYLIIAIALVPALAWDLFTAYYLSQIKIEERPLIEVIKRVNTYQRWLIRERLISILYLLGIATFTFINWEIWSYGPLAISAFTLLWGSGLTLVLWLYQNKFFKQIQRIKKNLSELNDLS